MLINYIEAFLIKGKNDKINFATLGREVIKILKENSFEDFIKGFMGTL